MATIELSFIHNGVKVRYGVMKDMPTPVYNGFVELETKDKVFHFRSKIAFPVYKPSFGACADAISTAFIEARALADELLSKPVLLDKIDILDRGVLIYDYFALSDAL